MDVLRRLSVTQGTSPLDLKELYETVTPHFAIHWKRIGVFLDIHHEELDIIEKDNYRNCKTCCDVMLKEWLNIDAEASWQKITAAVNSALQSESTQIGRTEHYLKQLYRAIQFTGPDEEIWPPWPDKPKFFASITLVHHKNAKKGKSKQEIHVMGRLRCKGDIMTVRKTTQTLRPPLQTQSIEISEYLASNNIIKDVAGIFEHLNTTEGTPSSRIILIDGAPGIGKTYLCKEIANQWSQGQILIEKRFLFLLHGHEHRVQLLKEVKDLIRYCCHHESEEIIDEVYQHIKETEGKTLIVLLDGYNELPVELPGDCLVSQLLSRQRLARCDILVTSRSFTDGCLCHLADCRIEILGFTNNDRQKYIQQALVEKPDEVKMLKHYLDSHPTISSLCYIPLNMTILLHLFTENNLPKSRSELYETIVDLTIKFHAMKDEKTYKILQRQNSLKECIKHKLASFSYNVLCEDRVIFSKEEITKVCPKITESPQTVHGFGLLQVTEHFTSTGKTLSFNFAHSSVQEYLAAFYIQSLPDDKQLDLLRDTFWNEKYLNTWIIYVGLTQGKSFAFKHFLSGNQFSLASKLFMKEFQISQKFLQDKVKCLHLFQCFMEVKDEAMCKIVGESMERRQIDLSKRKLLHDHIITLGFFLTHSYIVNWEKLDLSNCNMEDIGLYDLWNALVSKRQSKLCIKAINLSGNNLSEFCTGALIDLVKFCEPEKLYLSNNELGDKGAKQLISQLSSDTSLKILLLDGNSISTDVADQIDQNIRTFFPLNIVGTNSLYIQNINRPGDCIVEVLEWYATKCDLTKLSMCNCQVCDKNLVHILDLLVQNTKLERLQFSYIRLHESMIEIFANKLSSLKHLLNFSLEEPILSDIAADSLINSLSISSSTKVATISDKKLYARQTEYKEIAKFLKPHSLSITVLEIPECLPKEERYVDSLADVIKAAPLLQEIDLSKNNLCSTGVQRLAKSLKHIQGLQSIVMSSNSIDYVAAKTIADCLENKMCLKVLDLGVNKILSKGVKAIANSLAENATLKVLDLHNNDIELDAAPGLSSMLANKANLLEVNISQNSFGTEGMIIIAKALQNINTLNVLNVSSNGITTNASSDMAEVIRRNTSLEVLNVSANKLESLGCIKLCKALQKQHLNLKAFSIKNNGVKSVAAPEIARALQDKQKLEMVNVSWNEFEGGLATIVAALNSTRCLKELILHNSGTVNQRAVNAICDIINDNISLEVLDLGSTNILTSSADKIFRTMAHNKTLKVLNLKQNKIEDTSVNQLTSSLAHHPALKELFLHLNPLSDAAIQQIVFDLSNSTCLKKISVPHISNQQIKVCINKKLEIFNRRREKDNELELFQAGN